MQRRTFLTTVGGASLGAAFIAGGRGDARAGVSGRAGDGGRNVSDAPEIEPVGSVEVPSARDFEVHDRTAYLGVDDGFAVADLSDPADPRVIATWRELLSGRDGGPVFAARDAAVGGDGDRMLLTAGLDRDLGTGVAMLYDVSDPADPRRIAVHDTEFVPHNGSLDEAGETAYLTGSDLPDWPLVVLDLSGDRPREVARWSVLDERPDWEPVSRGVRRLHDVCVRDGLAYLAYWDAGTWILDVSDPTAPSPVAAMGARDPRRLQNSAYEGHPLLNPEVFELPGNATAARPNDDATLVAVPKEASDDLGTRVDGGPGGIDIWDASDPTAPERVTILAARDVGGASWAKNLGWRGNRLFTAWRDDGARVYDLSDPTAPRVLGFWPGKDTSTVHTARALPEGFAALDSVQLQHDEELTERLYVFDDPDAGGGEPAATETPRPTSTLRSTTTDPPASQATTGTPTVDPTTRTGRTPGPTTGGRTGGTTPGDATSPGAGTATDSRGLPGFTLLTALIGGGIAAWRLRNANRE